MASDNPKKKAGRPKSADPPRVLPLRLPGSLVDGVEAFAELHGISRNEAGRRLIQEALGNAQIAHLPPRPTSGYNPTKGAFE